MSQNTPKMSQGGIVGGGRFMLGSRQSCVGHPRVAGCWPGDLRLARMGGRLPAQSSLPVPQSEFAPGALRAADSGLGNRRPPGLLSKPVPANVLAPITASTRYCAVYGQPIRHSASPAFQNAGLAALGLDWRYLAFEVAPEALAIAIAGAKAMRFIGLNLTVPHKLLAVSLVEHLDESARAWGAVNTIRFEARDAQGQWRPLAQLDSLPASAEVRAHGFNTDADALVQALREDLGLALAGRRVVLLGAGGAGRTAALKLASEGVAELWLVNRTEAKAAALAQELGPRWPAVKVGLGYPAGPVELVLNATSLGLRSADPLPVDERRFSLGRAQAVFDMIYRPAQTPLLRAAHTAGCRTANGLGMLLYQGARAFELWTGQPAPLAVMRHALIEQVYGAPAALV